MVKYKRLFLRSSTLMNKSAEQKGGAQFHQRDSGNLHQEKSLKGDEQQGDWRGGYSKKQGPRGIADSPYKSNRRVKKIMKPKRKGSTWWKKIQYCNTLARSGNQLSGNKKATKYRQKGGGLGGVLKKTQGNKRLGELPSPHSW